MKEKKIMFGIFRVPDSDGSLAAKIFDDLGVERDGLTESLSGPCPSMEYIEVGEIKRCFLVDYKSSSTNHPCLSDGEEVIFEIFSGDRRNAYNVRRAFPQKKKNYPPGFDNIR